MFGVLAHQGRSTAQTDRLDRLLLPSTDPGSAGPRRGVPASLRISAWYRKVRSQSSSLLSLPLCQDPAARVLQAGDRLAEKYISLLFSSLSAEEDT